MTQLILDGIELPESQNKYEIRNVILEETVEMISGRIVKEVKGSAWEIDYQFGYFDETLRKQILEVCEKGRRQPITCGFLEPYSDGILTYSKFFVTDIKYPKFRWSTGGPNGLPAPIWLDFAVSLREVRPHD